MKAFSQAAFLRAAGRPEDLPQPTLPEIAFAGRSNVGKSSAINAILGRRALARTSKTPGRTQTINFYSLGEEALLVDFPGYGYARVPQALRAQWGELVEAYLRSREVLAGVVVLMDARHPLTPLDEQLLGWIKDAVRLIVLSKADKLSKVEQRAALERVQRRFPYLEVKLFSSVTRQGVEECRSLLEHWLEAGGARIKDPR
jgi:GTP-binding protein